MTTLTTERLQLRHWRTSDLPTFYKLNQCDHVTKYLPKKLTQEESDSLANIIQSHINEHGWGFWAVELRDTTEFIGFVGISHYEGDTPFSPAIEIGWRLAHQHWHKGYATEAALASLEYGFSMVSLEEIVAFTTVNNHASQRVMQKIGMTRDNECDFNHPNLAIDDPLAPHVLYRISPTR